MRLKAILFSILAMLVATPTVNAENHDNWMGLYGGAQFGWASIDNKFIHLDGSQPPFNIETDGILGGVLGGYNFQNDNFVFGLEGDFSLADLDGKWLANPDRVADVDWLATFRARAGILVGENILVYATGGLALADITFQHIGHVKWSDTYTGWTIGGGVETVVMNGIRVGFEALYLDFGREKDTHLHAGRMHTLSNDPSGVVVRGRIVVPLGIFANRS